MSAKTPPGIVFSTGGRNAPCEVVRWDAGNLQSPLRGASNIALIGLIRPPAMPVDSDLRD